MTELVKFSADDSALIVEVDENDFGMDRVARGSDGVIDASKRLDAAMATVEPSIRTIAKTLASLAPDSHEIEFGIKLNGEVGAFVAKSSLEGHFTVRMTWARQGDVASDAE